MAILIRTHRVPRAVPIALLVTALVAVPGCLVLQEFGWNEGGLSFNHHVHVVQEEMECIDCHSDYEDEDSPGMPPIEDCLECHVEDDPDMAYVPVEELVTDGVFATAGLDTLGDEVIFSHLNHLPEDEAGCRDCHADVAEAENMRDRRPMDMDGCVECHSEREVASECATCHAEIRADVAPWTHGGTWDRTHGLSVRDRSDLTVDRCDVCHEPATCTACHSDTPPANHNNHWRRRGHGLMASMDRQYCETCHRQDTCDACHQEARPLTHRGLWGGTRNTHCYSCHLGDEDRSCSVCHLGSPSHALAPLKPPGHDPASDCRSCHVILIHVDKGDDCNLCHF